MGIRESDKRKWFRLHLNRIAALTFSFCTCQSFDRWARDLETGDYAFLKNKYARLWAETPWATFSTIAWMDKQEQDARGGYAQQLFAECQVGNAFLNE